MGLQEWYALSAQPSEPAIFSFRKFAQPRADPRLTHISEWHTHLFLASSLRRRGRDSGDFKNADDLWIELVGNRNGYGNVVARSLVRKKKVRLRMCYLTGRRWILLGESKTNPGGAAMMMVERWIRWYGERGAPAVTPERRVLRQKVVGQTNRQDE